MIFPLTNRGKTSCLLKLAQFVIILRKSHIEALYRLYTSFNAAISSMLIEIGARVRTRIRDFYAVSLIPRIRNSRCT